MGLFTNGALEIANHLYNGIWYDYFSKGKWSWMLFSHENNEALTSLD